ncbi:hypothetical protein Dsin_014379 [Dipteronia sinensis]|uniref:DUF4220 domain-containing protein n=1 Tax=Dipteronia sinensis TaxID=43782 RepID=A0AAE0AN03_9ROSI|nr:hypothetical protein Dsin_014379 [Dipteronia sinensis]
MHNLSKSVVSSLIYSMKRRIVVELYSPSLRNLWKEWDARVTVVLSLTIQILLSILGNRRKSSRKRAIRLFIWLGYISADSVATFALGILSSNVTDMYDQRNNKAVDANTELAAFWAPFLLLHLGGPDSITAYALEDNELWLRQGIGLIVQTGMVLYVFLMGWTGSRLSVLSLVMFLPGLVKYGERVWILKSASDKVRRTSMDRTKYFYRKENFNKENDIKKNSGYLIGVDRLVEIQLPVDLSGLNNNNSITDEDVLLVAYGLMDISNRLFVDSTLNYMERDTAHTFFRNISSEDAFRVIEIELGLRYDLLYTKTLLILKPWRLCLRVFTFFLATLVLILFTALVHNKDRYSKVDLSITFMLLIVSFLLEIHAALVLLSSDWFLVWLAKKHYKTSNLMKALISSSLISLSKTPRWSNTMSQYSLLNFPNKAKPHLNSCNKLILNMIGSIHDFSSQYTDSDIPEDLRRLIFQFFKQKAAEESTVEVPTARESEEEAGNIKDIIPGISIREEFEYNIMVWHIATEVCYYLDREINPVNCKSIMKISRYLMYLLAEHPSMLSVGTGQNIYQEISGEIEHAISTKCAEIDVTRKNQVCDKLLEYFTSDEALKANKTNYTTNGFVIKTAFDLVKKMNKTYPSKPSDADAKWQKIGSKWFEMLVQAANNCRGNEHAQQLRRGGEFLTHVWLLMAYFGLTDHSVISREPRPIARLFTK